MEIIFIAIGTITGVLGAIISLFALNHNKIEAINSFFDRQNNLTYIHARRILEKLPNNYKVDEIYNEVEEMLEYLASHCELAALLVKKRQLPFYVFDKRGHVLVDTYEKLIPYIKFRRENRGVKYYCSNFEQLYIRTKNSIKA